MIIVVGERQGTGGTRRHLAALLGTDRKTMLESVVWINLWEIDGLDPENVARFVESGARPGDAILLLGRRVQRAFALDGRKVLDDVERNAGAGPVLVMVPHPSGRNRWWNDPAHEVAARDVLGAIWDLYR